MEADLMQNLEKRIALLEERVEEMQARMPEDQLSMVVFSGELDRLLAAFIIAVGAAAMYDRVVMFMTFWGTTVMRDPTKTVSKPEFTAKMFDKMLPSGPDGVHLSRMDMFGMGRRMMKSIMKKKGVLSLDDLIRQAADYGVEIVICEMSLDVMGLSADELRDYPNITLAGVAKFLQEANQSAVTLFI
ncbi:DsrE/DsrF/DrsH-like family protein [Oceanidesulfovibrio marinus]|uniref:NADH dehydrogenase FAD-containing subunit n=1 Tax=Oceanidesulfovibrio marinus TaxID=370038 RepID=A0A6P1ZES2_9BACT|nr:DsrE/DsrF/DrsH-like family protein [Oceanidesulfovibrio marinus]TVM32111.1 NADH dehydrogenase FAD-containing subunit [Oceanidesulfovibrio marinus]